MPYVREMEPTTQVKPVKMTINQFMKDAGSDEVKKLFTRVQGGTFSECHPNFYRVTGIWIPELVPIFKKMDAMMVLRDAEIKPKGI